MFLAEAHAAAGRSDDAMQSAREARELFETKGNIVSARRARGFAAAGIVSADTGARLVRGTGRIGYTPTTIGAHGSMISSSDLAAAQQLAEDSAPLAAGARRRPSIPRDRPAWDCRIDR